jgi:tetratricopeptide (TPR) repeat protein
VTDALRVRLTSSQQSDVTKRYTENTEAYRLYLQGRYYENEGTDEDNQRAVSLFSQAIALDPRYALAYAARGRTYFDMGDISLSMSEAVPKAKQDTLAALQIDDKVAEAHLTLANIEFQADWDFVRAERDFKQLIALNPNYAEVHHSYMYYLVFTGKPIEGLGEIKLAQQLDPVNQFIVTDSALPYYMARRYDESIAESRKALEMFPNFFLPHVTLGVALAEKGEYDASIQELEKARSLGADSFVIPQLGYVYARAGRKDDARKALADLTELSRKRFVAPYAFTTIYAGLNQKDDAFTWLEKAYQERSWWLCWIKMDPKMDSLRSDARFNDLMSRVGFPQ